MTPVPSIQGFSEHELAAVGMVIQVQPVIDLTPFSCALCDCRSRFPRVDTADHDVHAVQSSSSVEPLGNALPIQAPKPIQPVGENHRFIETQDVRMPAMPDADR